jgi:hypothetical protein
MPHIAAACRRSEVFAAGTLHTLSQVVAANFSSPTMLLQMWSEITWRGRVGDCGVGGFTRRRELCRLVSGSLITLLPPLSFQIIDRSSSLFPWISWVDEDSSPGVEGDKI